MIQNYGITELRLRVQLCNDVTGRGSIVSLLAQTPLDESQQWLVEDLEELACSVVTIWEFPCQHLHQENPKAEDVHLGGLLGGVVGFRGCVSRVARTLRLQLLKELDCAIV